MENSRSPVANRECGGKIRFAAVTENKMIKSVIVYLLLILVLSALFITSPVLSLIASLGLATAFACVAGIQDSELDALKMHSGSRRLATIG